MFKLFNYWKVNFYVMFVLDGDVMYSLLQERNFILILLFLLQSWTHILIGKKLQTNI